MDMDVITINMVPQRFRLLGTVKETNMLGNAKPKNHAKYKVGDRIVFREWFGKPGPWGGEFGDGRQQKFEITKIKKAGTYRNRAMNISIQQVRLFLKRVDRFKLKPEELEAQQ